MNERRLSVTNALIIINAVVFFVGLMVQREAILCIPYPQAARTSIFEILCAYSWFTCFLEGEIWRLITYQFVHAISATFSSTCGRCTFSGLRWSTPWGRGVTCSSTWYAA